MSEKINLVLARHHDKDIARVFQVPAGVEVKPMEMLLCDTAAGDNQLVTSISPNFLLDEDKLDGYLAFNGTKVSRLKPITGRLSSARFKSAEPEKKEPEKKEDGIPGIHVQKVAPGVMSLEIDDPGDDDDDEDMSIFALCDLGLSALRQLLDFLAKRGGAECQKEEFVEQLEAFNHALVEAAIYGMGAMVELPEKDQKD